jgi:hypothetical protein
MVGWASKKLIYLFCSIGHNNHYLNGTLGLKRTYFFNCFLKKCCFPTVQCSYVVVMSSRVQEPVWPIPGVAQVWSSRIYRRLHGLATRRQFWRLSGLRQGSGNNRAYPLSSHLHSNNPTPTSPLKKTKFSSYIRKFRWDRGCKVIFEEGFPNIWGNAQIFNHLQFTYEEAVSQDFITEEHFILFFYPCISWWRHRATRW